MAFVTKPEGKLGGLKESWKSSAPREQLEKEYEAWTENVQRIIRAMTPVVSKWKLNDRELLSQWCYMDGKVVLSGDAAHAMLPHQGPSYNTVNGIRPPRSAHLSDLYR